MVLICKNNILTIDQFHKNRCEEKNRTLDIYVKLKYRQKEEIQPIAKPSETFQGTLTRTVETYQTFSNKAYRYNTKQNGVR